MCSIKDGNTLLYHSKLCDLANYSVEILTDKSTSRKHAEVRPNNGKPGAILLYNVDAKNSGDWQIMADLCRMADEEYEPVWRGAERIRDHSGSYLYYSRLCDISGYRVVHVQSKDPDHPSPYFGVSTHHDGVHGTISLYNVDPNNPNDWPIMAEMCWKADQHYSFVWKEDLAKQCRPCEPLELPANWVVEEVEAFLKAKASAPKPSQLELAIAKG